MSEVRACRNAWISRNGIATISAKAVLFIAMEIAADICSALWGAADVWVRNEQVFLKEGGTARRTPWHQDASYTPYGGERLAVMWINFDPVDQADSLEFVRGSHRGPLFSGPGFDPVDDTRPAWADSPLPRIPDIERERERWDIVSFAVEPGDVVVFHNRTLHGGGGTRPGRRRRTLSLRFFGDDVVREVRGEAPASERRSQGGQVDAELLSGWGGLVESLAPGEPLHHRPEFFRLRPRATA